MSLLDILTGGKSSEASGDLEAALAAIQGVQTPTAQDMQFQLQKLVQAGVLTPEQAQTFLQAPNALASENVPQTGTTAQEEAIGNLLSEAQAGGLSPTEEAATQQMLQQLNTQEKGANDAILQDAAARGTLTGGETLASELESNQAQDVNANQTAGENAANAYQQMLQELTSAGGLGSGLQGQENTQANTVASATNAINEFNAAQEQAVQNENVAAQNEAQKENLATAQGVSSGNVEAANAHALQQSELPQTVYEDQLQKAAAEAGVSEAQASNATTQGGQEAGLIGGLVGTAGDVAAAGMAPAPNFNFPGVAPAAPAASSGIQTGEHGGLVDYLAKGGGVVPGDGKPNIPGDSPKNDRIPALLSKDEVVLPRSVAQPAMQGHPDKVIEFLQRMRKPRPATHPEDVKTVLDALGRMRGAA